jgi:manganese/zinc/iron transport system permease protein
LNSLLAISTAAPETWIDSLLRVLTLADYNTRVVILGTSTLGTACGVIGSFMLLRKRSLMADSVSHATLPGICLAFMIMVASGGTGKWLPGLLLGALLSGLLGMGLVLLLRNYTRVKEDAALGIVLSCFFGLGVALLGMIQKMSRGSAAGLESFIYGKTASMLSSDAYLIGLVALISLLICGALFKEFTLLCFDQDYAGSQGYSVAKLDVLLMTLVVLITVIGLQAVGLILVIALLIIPPAAARFWTHRLVTMTVIAAILGAFGSAVGAALSAVIPKLPAGAIIVVTYSVLFFLSMLVGKEKGILVRQFRRYRLNQKVGLQHALRAIHEAMEKSGQEQATLEELLEARSWPRKVVSSLLQRCLREGHASKTEEGYTLTDSGHELAQRLVRNHRLWELYLITYADIAPSHVDRDADRVEHILSDELITELEALLAEEYPSSRCPQCPHSSEAR